MKKIVSVMLIVSILALSGCGEPITRDGVDYPTYGLLNEETKKSNKICYDISVGNVILSVLFVETIVFPIYFVGFSLYNPGRSKRDAKDDCTVDYTPAK
jgi:hypothetical protein